MTDDMVHLLTPGQQLFFCVFSTHDDVSGLLFGIGAFLQQTQDGRLLLSTGKGQIETYAFQTFLRLEQLTSYLIRSFPEHILHIQDNEATAHRKSTFHRFDD